MATNLWKTVVLGPNRAVHIDCPIVEEMPPADLSDKHSHMWHTAKCDRAVFREVQAGIRKYETEVGRAVTLAEKDQIARYMCRYYELLPNGKRRNTRTWGGFQDVPIKEEAKYDLALEEENGNLANSIRHRASIAYTAVQKSGPAGRG